MQEMDLSCRCQGRKFSDPCSRQADGEDGLCRECRLMGVVLRWDGYGQATCCEDIPTDEYDSFYARARYADAQLKAMGAKRTPWSVEESRARREVNDGT